MMKLWKYSGTFLIATGILHLILAIARNWQVYKEMCCGNLINSVDNVENAFAFWFFITGVLIILWGQTLQYYIKREGQPAPLFLGYLLLLVSVIGCVMLPISGFWLFIPQALIIILADRSKG